MAQDGEKFLANFNMLLTFGFHAMPGIYWLTKNKSTFQKLMLSWVGLAKMLKGPPEESRRRRIGNEMWNTSM